MPDCSDCSCSPIFGASPSIKANEVSFIASHTLFDFATDNQIPIPQFVRPSSNYPIAYTKGTKPKMTLKIGINPPLAAGCTCTATIRARELRGGQMVTVASVSNITLSGAETVIPGFTFDISPSSVVKKTSHTFGWEISFGGDIWCSLLSTGPHDIYWTAATPTVPKLYVLAVVKACEYINGGADYPGIINTKLTAANSGIVYNPSATPPIGYASGNGESIWCRRGSVQLLRLSARISPSDHWRGRRNNNLLLVWDSRDIR